jgi:hypothetical protein
MHALIKSGLSQPGSSISLRVWAREKKEFESLSQCLDVKNKYLRLRLPKSTGMQVIGIWIPVHFIRWTPIKECEY